MQGLAALLHEWERISTDSKRASDFPIRPCYDREMADGDALFKVLDEGIWEMGEAFKGLDDADVWRRPHENLLSIGELAAHVAYWEAETFLGKDFKSELTDLVDRYYLVTLEEPKARQMGAEAVYNEVKRIHEASKQAFFADSPDLESNNPHREDWTWGSVLRYQIFHVAYHTGQMYSVRHLMGHETEDN